MENVRQTSRISKKMKIEKNVLSTHISFRTFVKCNPYQNCKENLAVATRSSENFKKYVKNQNFTFSKILGDRTLRLHLPRG